MSGRFSRLEMAQAQREEAVEAAIFQGAAVRTAEMDLSLADDAYRDGRFEEALQQYTRALGRRQSMLPAWVGQVQMLVELGEHAEARLWADKSLELFKNNGDLLAAKSRACLFQGDGTAALQCSDASIQSPGTSPLRWQARGEVQLAREGRRAKDCFEKALAEPAADWFDRVVIARAYLRGGKGLPALEMAREATSLRPAHAYCWCVLGEAQEAVGWIGEALASYQRGLDVSPGHAMSKASLKRVSNLSAGARFSQRVRGWFQR